MALIHSPSPESKIVWQVATAKAGQPNIPKVDPARKDTVKFAIDGSSSEF